MSIGETDGMGSRKSSEVLANVKTSDTREGFVAHTPTPWHTDKYSAYIWGPAQEMVADSSMGDLPDNAVARARGVGGKLPIKANMAFIVRAVNSHDDLLAALKKIDHTLSVHGHVDASTELHGVVRAVIARAEGKTP